MSMRDLPMDTLSDLNGDTEIAITVLNPSSGVISTRRCRISDFATLLAASDVKEPEATEPVRVNDGVFTKYTMVVAGSIEPTAFNRAVRSSVTITNIVQSPQDAREWQNRVKGLVEQARAKQGEDA